MKFLKEEWQRMQDVTLEKELFEEMRSRRDTLKNGGGRIAIKNEAQGKRLKMKADEKQLEREAEKVRLKRKAKM